MTVAERLSGSHEEDSSRTKGRNRKEREHIPVGTVNDMMVAKMMSMSSLPSERFRKSSVSPEVLLQIINGH